MINYHDSALLLKIKSSGYKGKNEIVDQDDVPGIFVDSSGLSQANFQDGINADAVFYADPESEFMIKYNYEVNGFSLMLPSYDGLGERWYMVTQVTVNKNHLLGDEIDNVELRLKKSSPVTNIAS